MVNILFSFLCAALYFRNLSLIDGSKPNECLLDTKWLRSHHHQVLAYLTCHALNMSHENKNTFTPPFKWAGPLEENA